MIVIKVPFRVSFVGGGTDIKKFYRYHAGQVISTTINKYIYVSLKKSINKFTYLKYSKFEKVNDIEKIKHPIIRVIFKRYGITNVDLSCSSDIPAGSGLASSSAFTIAVLKAVKNFLNLEYTNASIAEECCDIEINILKEPIGKQDQYAISYGGLNHIVFNKNETVKIQSIRVPNPFLKKFNDCCIFASIGKKRSAKSILSEQTKKINNKKNIQLYKHLSSLVGDFNKALNNQDILSIGKVVNEGWLIKKNLSENISNKIIDDYISFTEKYNSIGSKLLGAGKGGYVLSIFPNKRYRDKFLQNNIHKINYLDINFINNNGHIINV